LKAGNSCPCPKSYPKREERELGKKECREQEELGKPKCRSILNPQRMGAYKRGRTRKKKKTWWGRRKLREMTEGRNLFKPGKERQTRLKVPNTSVIVAKGEKGFCETMPKGTPTPGGKEKPEEVDVETGGNNRGELREQEKKKKTLGARE